jgi:hypothetical protein
MNLIVGQLRHYHRSLHRDSLQFPPQPLCLLQCLVAKGRILVEGYCLPGYDVRVR